MLVVVGVNKPIIIMNAIITPINRGKKTRYLIRVFDGQTEVPGCQIQSDTRIDGKVSRRNLLTTYSDLSTVKSLLYLTYPDLSII